MTEDIKFGTLYMVATPIGNLGDITLRALETLKNVDAIFAEDTRVTSKLLFHYKIQKPVFHYDEHSHNRASAKLMEMLKGGNDIALVTDAGTPGIADPGSRLVDAIVRELPQVQIIPIPGVSAVISLLSISGVNTEQFTFLGYPPHKKGRKTFFESLREIKTWPVVFYESPHRIEKALSSVVEVLGSERAVIIGRELTKLHEDVFRGTALTALEYIKKADKQKGEFAVAISEH